MNSNNASDFKWASDTRSKGVIAEDLAVDYFLKKGYKVVKRNFRFGKVGEIDLICLDGNVLAFIEVKARSNNAFGDPLFSITPQKQRTIRKVADAYLYINKIINVECRFDVLTIDFTKNEPEFNHLIAAM